MERILSYDRHVKSRESFFPFLDRMGNKIPDDLRQATACLCIGTCTGLTETGFFQRCMPNVNEILAVEPDGPSCNALKETMSDTFPAAALTVCKEKVDTWSGPHKPVDVVTMFHMLYYVPRSKRPDVYRRCFEEWLKPGGWAVISIDRNRSCFYHKILEHLPADCNRRISATADNILQELEQGGYNIEMHVYHFQVEIDTSDVEQSNYVSFSAEFTGCDETTVLNAIKMAVPARKGVHDDTLILAKVRE